MVAVRLAADKPSPQPSGTELAFAATASGGGAGGAEYQFWLVTDETGSFVPVGDITTGYSTADTWHWTPLAAGTYRVMVLARTEGSLAPYEKIKVIAFTVN